MTFFYLIKYSELIESIFFVFEFYNTYSIFVVEMRIKIQIIFLIIVLFTPVILTSVADVFEINELIELTEKMGEEEKNEEKSESEQEEEMNMSEFINLSSLQSFHFISSSDLNFRNHIKFSDFEIGVVTPPPEQT